MANSIYLPHVMRFNAPHVLDRYARIGRVFGINTGGRSQEDVVGDLIAAIQQLAVDCGLPTRLRDVDVPEESLEQIAEQAFSDGALFHNPCLAEPADLLEIARAAW